VIYVIGPLQLSTDFGKTPPMPKKTVLSICLCCSTIGLSAGCAKYSLPDIKVTSTELYNTHKEMEGLSMAIDPYIDKEKMDKFFGMNLTDKGIIPVMIIIENHSKSSYLVEKNAFSIAALDGSFAKDKSLTSERQSMTRTARATSALMLAAPFAPFGGVAVIVGLPIASYFDNKEQEIHRQIGNNEISDKTLFPTESMHGFVYLQGPSASVLQRIESLSLSIKIKNMESGNVLDFSFPLRQK